LRHGERLVALRSAAAVAMRHAHVPVAQGFSAGPEGALILAVQDRALVAPPAVVARCVEAARRRVEAHHDDVSLGYGPEHGGAAIAAAPFAGEWSVRAKGLPTSTLLGYVVLTCYLLAGAALLFGNLLVWRLT